MIVWPNSTGHIQKAATLSCFPTTEAAGSTPLPPCCSASHFLRCLHCCHLHALWKFKGHMQSWHMELEEVVEYIFYIHVLELSDLLYLFGCWSCFMKLHFFQQRAEAKLLKSEKLFLPYLIQKHWCFQFPSLPEKWRYLTRLVARRRKENERAIRNSDM